MTRSHKRFTDVTFCPSCGCESLQKDDYAMDNGKQKPHEFICLACGFGFRIVPSLRWQCASTLFKEHRKQRVSLTGTKIVESSTKPLNRKCVECGHDYIYAGKRNKFGRRNGKGSRRRCKPCVDAARKKFLTEKGLWIENYGTYNRTIYRRTA